MFRDNVPEEYRNGIEYEILGGVGQALNRMSNGFLAALLYGINNSFIGGQGTEFLPPQYYRLSLEVMEDDMDKKTRHLDAGAVTTENGKLVYSMTPSGGIEIFMEVDLAEPGSVEWFCDRIISDIEDKSSRALRKANIGHQQDNLGPRAADRAG